MRRKAKHPVGMSKSLISGLVIVCFLADPVVGVLAWLHCKKTGVRKEVSERMAAGIEKDQLVVLKFSKEEARTLLRWENAGEFELNNEMYDVAETQTLGDTIFYWCWPDEKETRLNRRLEELSTLALRIKPKIGDKNSPLISGLRSLVCRVVDQWEIPELERLFDRRCPFFNSYFSVAIPPPTPPPELA